MIYGICGILTGMGELSEAGFTGLKEVGNRSSLLQKSRESEFPPTEESGIGVPSYRTPNYFWISIFPVAVNLPAVSV